MVSIVVRENLGEYRPPFDVSATIERLVGSVDPKYLAGLEAVVLSSRSSLNRKGRRRASKSRGKKVWVRDCLGLYERPRRGQPAWIELFVDTILAGATLRSLRFRFVQETVVAETLFHELGHHIHATQAPEHADPEDVAEKWRSRLEIESFSRLHPVWSRVLAFSRPVLLPLINRWKRRFPKRTNGLSAGRT